MNTKKLYVLRSNHLDGCYNYITSFALYQKALAPLTMPAKHGQTVSITLWEGLGALGYVLADNADVPDAIPIYKLTAYDDILRFELVWDEQTVNSKLRVGWESPELLGYLLPDETLDENDFGDIKPVYQLSNTGLNVERTFLVTDEATSNAPPPGWTSWGKVGYMFLPGESPATPPEKTPENITRVQNNLRNLRDLIEGWVNWFPLRISTCVQLAETNDHDPGVQSGSNIVYAAANVLADVSGLSNGASISGFLYLVASSVYNQAASSGSPDIHQTFATYYDRIRKHLEALEYQLDVYRQDPVSNWESSIKDSITGEEYRLYDLATFDIPSETDNSTAALFDKMRMASETASEAELWKLVTRSSWAHWGWNKDRQNAAIVNDSLAEAQSTAQYQSRFPEIWSEIVPTSTPSGDKWFVYNHWLAKADDRQNPPSRAFCEKLFKDDNLGNIVRPDSIATRKQVFLYWGLNKPSY